MNTGQILKLNQVISEVINERFRQHTKFGEQNCPSLCQDILNGHRATADTMSEFYNIPNARVAKALVDASMKRNKLTFADILIEEVCEVVDCMDDEEKMREELIQVAAVAVQWIEAIDRRRKA